MGLNFKVIGKRIKELRHEKCLSQETLAEMCNLSTSYISGIESGKKKASLKSYAKIGDILETPIAIILNNNQNNDFLEYKSKLMLIIEDCNNYEQQVIFDLIIAIKRSLRNN